MKIFLSLNHPLGWMYIRIHISNFNKKQRKKQEDKKRKRKYRRKENICGKSNGIPWYRLRICCVPLTYLMEFWISPGCSWEFNEVYVQREKLFVIPLHHEAHTFKNKNKRKSIKRHFCLLRLFNCSCNFLIIAKHSYDIAHDKNAMSTLIIQSIW